jgi:hypothetical protein
MDNTVNVGDVFYLHADANPTHFIIKEIDGKHVEVEFFEPRYEYPRFPETGYFYKKDLIHNNIANKLSEKEALAIIIKHS